MPIPPLPPLPCQHNISKCLEQDSPQDFLIADLRHEREERAKLPIQPRHHQNADDLIANGLRHIARVGVQHAAILTITCRKGTTLPTARKLFTRAWRQDFSKLFAGCISVLDIHQDGRPHLHCLVTVPFDITAGFDKTAYRAMRQLSEDGCHNEQDHERRRMLGRSLTRNSNLRAFWRKLRKTVKRTGFAPRVELCPILETPEQAVKYLAGAYYRAVRFVREHKIKHCHCHAYAGDIERSRYSKFVPQSSPWTVPAWRANMGAIGTALNVTDNTIKQRYGPKWGYHFRQIMDDLEVTFGHDPKRWKADMIRRYTDLYFKRLERFRLRRESERKLQADLARAGLLMPVKRKGSVTVPEFTEIPARYPSLMHEMSRTLREEPAGKHDSQATEASGMRSHNSGGAGRLRLAPSPFRGPNSSPRTP